jgi:hypothetical protein
VVRVELLGQIKCKVCGLVVEGRYYKLAGLDLCRDCGFLVSAVLSADTKYARAEALGRLIERMGINEGKTEEEKYEEEEE